MAWGGGGRLGFSARFQNSDPRAEPATGACWFAGAGELGSPCLLGDDPGQTCGELPVHRDSWRLSQGEAWLLWRGWCNSLALAPRASWEGGAACRGPAATPGLPLPWLDRPCPSHSPRRPALCPGQGRSITSTTLDFTVPARALLCWEHEAHLPPHRLSNEVTWRPRRVTLSPHRNAVPSRTGIASGPAVF